MKENKDEKQIDDDFSLEDIVNDFDSFLRNLDEEKIEKIKKHIKDYDSYEITQILNIILNQ